MTARGSLELVSGTWWLRVPQRTVDPATGVARYRRPRIKLGRDSDLRSRVAARRVADAWFARLDPEELTPGLDTLAVEYLERFLAVHVSLMRPTTQRRYRTTIRSHLAPAFAGRMLHEIRTAVLQEMVADLAQRLEPATVGHIRALALQVLRQARRDGFMVASFDPREIRQPKARTMKPERRAIGDGELKQILAASHMPWRLLWALMGFAGLRIGEALGLRWADVDHERGVLRVRQNAVEGYIQPPKTRTSQAAVPILVPLADLLREFHAEWRPNPLDLLFASRRGTAISSDSIRRRRLAPLLASLGLQPAGCHAFRHGLPGRLFAAACTPDTVRRVMRHGSLTMTAAYSHGDEIELASNVARASEHFAALCKTAQSVPNEPRSSLAGAEKQVSPGCIGS